MLPAPPVLSHTDARFIHTGHYNEKVGYQNLRPNGTGDWLAIYTVAGKGRFGYSTPASNNDFVAEPGDLTLIRPRVPHDYGVESSLCQWELLWAHFQPRPHWLDLLDFPNAVSGSNGLTRVNLPAGPVRDELFRLFQLADEAAHATGPRAIDHAMHHFEAVLLVCDAYNPQSQQSRIDTRVRDAMDFMSRNLATKMTLADVADTAGLSVSRLSALFKLQLNIAPLQFLEQQRLKRAERLLQLTSLSVKEIAYRVGFENPFYFTLRFKRHTGTNPRTYRRQHDTK